MKTVHRLILAALAAFVLCLGARAANEDKTWMVVDLRTGALSYYGYNFTTATNIFNTAEFKTEKMVFRRIPAGLYWAQDGEARAIMQNDYYMAIFPTTVGQYAIINNKEVVVDPNDEQNLYPKRDLSWENLILSSNSPVSKLGQLVYSYGETTSLSFMVPTVAMWEVATRAMPANDDSHKTWRWFFADSYDDIAQYAWLNNMLRWDTRPVGSYLPNDWGLYDVYGNCREWCKDTYSLYVQPVSEWWAESIPDIPSMVGYDSYSQQTAVDYRFYNGTEVVERDVRCCCGYYEYVDGPISSSSVLGVKQTEDGGVRIAIICTNECSAPPVTITWQDHSGNVLEVDTVPLGSAVSYDGPQPTRADDEEGYDYFFHRWEPYVGMAVTNTTFTPSFFFTARPYTIHWLNYDGVELCSSIVGYGSTPAYADATPTKPSTVEYEYTFTGWNPEPAAVTGETTYVAQFMQSARKYDITWLNYDGSTNATTRTPYNTTPEFEGETPTKPADVQYAYTFAGWTPELEPVTSNAAYTAVFDESIREYPVNFYNNTGSELLFTTNVPYGSTPEYLGETPTKPSTAQYHYSFAGWGRDMMVVDGPSFYNDYYAEFDPILRSYDITWVNYDGTVLCVTNGPYGETPVYLGAKPGRQAMDQYVYVFAGWTQEVVPVTSNATYEALHKLARGLRVVDVSDLNDSYTAQDGDVLTGVTTFGISIADNATVSLADMTSPGLACLGNATILIADDTVNTLNGTLRAGGAGSTLTIQGETGWLTTMASGNGAGIGALGNVACGNIVIEGGVIVAIGSGTGSGIGAGMSSGGCGNITISGGNVRAIGGTGGAPGIGCNRLSTCGDIVISGGVIAAEGYAAFNNDNAQMINWRPIYGTASMRIEGAITRLVSINHPDYRGRGSPIPGCDDAYGTIINTTIDEGLKQTQEGNTFTLEPKERFDITWANYDGMVLCVTNVPYGITPVYNGATPTKPPTATTQFVFSGWTETVVPVTEPATYTAAYTETPRPYPVTWLDYDGTVLCVTNVPCGETPTYPGETLKRPGYYFNGWTPAVEAVTEEAAYTATYKNMVQDSDGYYLLGSVQDWQGFATLVEATPTANAKMIADIDLGDDQTHIGSMYENSNGGPDYSVYYKGIFDGQGHTLTVAYDALDKQISAPFTKIQGALVKNLHVAGTIHAVSAYIGVVGMTSGDNCISNVWMSADITRPQSGWLFSASILGRYESGTVTIVDCLFTGSSIGGGERYMGCFVGGTRDYYARVVIRNCLSVGTFDRGSGISSSVHANCYVKQFPTDIPAEMQVTDEQLADGTTAAALQAGREEAVWVQDAEMGHPMLKMFGKKETTVTVGGVAVGEVVRGEDGKTLSFAVAAGTGEGDVKLDIGGVDVTKGFLVTVNGTEATAVLLGPYEVPKEALDGMWTENGDGTVTLNVAIVPGLYYAADSAASLDALACPGASAPATGATTLTAPKPVGDKGFFKVWVSDAPIPAKP